MKKPRKQNDGPLPEDTDPRAEAAYNVLRASVRRARKGDLEGAKSFRMAFDDAEKGRKFGPPPERRDALAKLIKEALESLPRKPKPSAESVLEEVLRLDPKRQVIEDIEGEGEHRVIRWTGSREGGTSIKRFRDRISSLRKKS